MQAQIKHYSPTALTSIYAYLRSKHKLLNDRICVFNKWRSRISKYFRCLSKKRYILLRFTIWILQALVCLFRQLNWKALHSNGAQLFSCNVIAASLKYIVLQKIT